MTHYFLGNRLLAVGQARPMWSDTQQEFNNIAHLCPTCGEAWARVVLSSEAEWVPVRSGCPQHPWTSDLGGTFIAPWLHTLGAFPPDLLVYEFNLRYERLQNGNS